MQQKLVLSQHLVDELRELFLAKEGRTDEEFDKWLDECVLICQPIEEPL